MMMAPFFDSLYEFLGENDDEEYIIGGDFNTVINSNIDKFGRIKGSHQICMDKIISCMESFDLSDAWRVLDPNTRQYTWHSSSKPVIFQDLIISLYQIRFLTK